MILPIACLVITPAPQDLPWPPAPPLEREAGESHVHASSITTEPAEAGSWRVSFAFAGEEAADSVHLAGDFNGWSAQATPMTRGGEGDWRVTISLKGGVHFYKLVVNEERWLSDPANEEKSDDGQGGYNSVLRLGTLGNMDLLDLRVGDDRFGTAALEHDPARPLYRQQLADGRVLLRFRTFAHDVSDVEFAARGLPPAAMHPVLAAERFQYWETTIAAAEDALEYTFVLSDGEERRSHPDTYELQPGGEPRLVTPDWSKDAVWYQIMVDRFRNGDPKSDPSPVRPWTSDWMKASEFEGRDGQTFWRYYVFQRLYGGDFEGVRQRLDYLQELGVTALYLNPVFEASGHHKYNARNFLHIDDHYGGGSDYARAEAEEDLLDPSTWTWTESDRVFLDLIKELHSRGMKVILDGVFNHVGDDHVAFRDVRENGKDSRFADWFDVRSWEPFEYRGWAGFRELPVFAKDADGFASPSVEAHVFALTRRWMDPDGDGDPADGIDGWRLDVPNEVAMPFWSKWRDLVKSINPDAYISGEIWRRADSWLDGRHFDAVMNYPFAESAVEWVGNVERKLRATQCEQRLAELRLAYPEEATYALMNLVDSHDTDRIASMLKNPDRDFDHDNRVQDGAKYDASKPGPTHYRRARLIALMQMTYVGAPMVYYGDEVGMWGADDPTNRKPMLWKDLEPYERPKDNRVDEKHLAHYRRVIALRREHSALRRGTYRTLLVDDDQDVIVFLREDASERVIVAWNASSRQARVQVPELQDGDWRCIYGAEKTEESGVRVPSIDGRVWVSSR